MIIMQELVQTRKIMDDERKQIILEVLADKYCKQILHDTLEKPKSAMEIVAETETPISTVYRRIQTLYDNKLIQSSGMITDDGKKLFLYKSKIKGINSKYCDGQIEVELIFN